MLNQQEPKGESFGKQALTIHKLHKPIVLILSYSIVFFLFLFFLHILELSLPPQHQVGSANHRTCDSRNHPVRSRQIPSDRHSLTLTQAIGVEATTGWEVLTATELLTVVVNSCDSCGSETEAFVGAFIFLPVLIRFRKLLYIVL